MKRLQAIPLLIGFLFASTAGVVNAQSASDKADASPTRAQVRMERDEFIKTHHYDDIASNWVLNSGVEPPSGMKTRAEIRAERDEFLRNNHYDTRTDNWVPLKTNPRNLATLSRAQMRNEMAAFLRTHRWDDLTGAWVAQSPARKSK